MHHFSFVVSWSPDYILWEHNKLVSSIVHRISSVVYSLKVKKNVTNDPQYYFCQSMTSNELLKWTCCCVATYPHGHMIHMSWTIVAGLQNEAVVNRLGITSYEKVSGAPSSSHAPLLPHVRSRWMRNRWIRWSGETSDGYIMYEAPSTKFEVHFWL